MRTKEREGGQERWEAKQSKVACHHACDAGATQSHGRLLGKVCSSVPEISPGELCGSAGLRCPLWEGRREEDLSTCLLLGSGFSLGNVRSTRIRSPALPHRTVRSPRGLPTRESRSRAPRHCVLQPWTCRADTDSGGLAGWPSCRNGWKGLTEFLSDTISHMRITKAPSAPHSPSVSPLGRSNSSGILSLSTAPDPLTCPPELVTS